jgi:hypothetical protein
MKKLGNLKKIGKIRKKIEKILRKSENFGKD